MAAIKLDMYKSPTDMTIPFWFSWFPKSWWPYFYLARWDRPIGIWLAFFPCLWTFELIRIKGLYPDLRMYGFFLLGAVLMRGAGCIINDIIDIPIDRKVVRTRERPLASGALGPMKAWGFLGIHLALAFCIAWRLGKAILPLSFLILGFVSLYPWMKRWTYWPQLFLGIVFNSGILMVWLVYELSLSPSVLCLYAASVLWTLFYDTIYGLQDRADDLREGLKSTSLLFWGSLKPFLLFCSIGMVSCLGAIGMMEHFSQIYFFCLWILFSTFVFRVGQLKKGSPSQCLSLFREQRWIGLFVCLMFLLVKVEN